MAENKREYIPESIRQDIYNKYNGKCAYCGCDITYKEMELDHFIPFKLTESKNYQAEDIQSIDNYMPACRLCNNFKRAKPIEVFRHNLEQLNARLMPSYEYRLALNYGLVVEDKHPIKFYYEQLQEEENND